MSTVGLDKAVVCPAGWAEGWFLWKKLKRELGPHKRRNNAMLRRGVKQGRQGRDAHRLRAADVDKKKYESCAEQDKPL